MKFVLQLRLPAAHTLQENLLVGIGEGRIPLTGIVITLLRLSTDLLVILQVDACLAGAIVCDEALQACLYRVGHGGSNQRVLVCDIDGDDHRLLVDIANDLLADGLNDLSLFLRQFEGVDLLILQLLFPEQ